MRTNLIQSYLYDNKIAQQYNAERAQKDFDIHKELANRTFIKPLPSNGELVRNSIFDEPSELFKDLKYDWKSFKDALRGEANDHELGTLNDLGMKIGGLAIASYLLTKKQTPLLKIMEFVGLTTFFGAMSLWPKLALQLPARLIHGFDIRQEYRDNNGTKKRVFLDHQFIPWDLYSDKEINKIGDRMNVPKDMKNRRDYIQEKMRKIALQNNTLWMLTAGFATPVMSALLCNAIEEPLRKYLNEKQSIKADNLLVNFEQEISKIDFSENAKRLNNLLEQNRGKALTPQLIKNISEILSEGFDPITASGLESDLENLMGKKGLYNVDSQVVHNISDLLKRRFATSGLSADELVKLIPNEEELLRLFEEKSLIKDGISDFSSHIKFIQNLIDKNADNLFENDLGNPLRQKINLILERISSSNVPQKESELKTILKSNSSNILSDDLIHNIDKISEVLHGFMSRNKVLEKFAYMKAAQAQETVLANTWNELAGELPDLLGITREEMKQTRFDRVAVGNLLRSKLEKIASSEEEYSKIVGIIQSKLSKLQAITNFADEEKIFGNGESAYKTRVNTTYDEAADALYKLKMNTVARRLVGYDKTKDSTSLKHLQLSFVVDRVRGVRNSFYQILNTLDVYRRISKKEFLEVLGPEMPLETKEELVEMCKQLLIDGHTSDYASKFYSLRNSELNPKFKDALEEKKYKSGIETLAGKVVNKKLGKRNPKDLVELSNDKNFFLDAIKLMYGGQIHTDTDVKLNDSLIRSNFMKYRAQMREYMGGDHYFAKPFHQLYEQGVKSSSEFKFLLKGCSLDDMFLNLFKNKFNSHSWFKTFGLFGASLLGVTILSQFFFGHMPKDKAQIKGDK